MVNLNKSFLYGICFASITWIVSLYLYFEITNENSAKKPAEYTLWNPEQMTLTHKTTTETNKSRPEVKKLKLVQNRNRDVIDNGKYVLVLFIVSFFYEFPQILNIFNILSFFIL